MGRKRLFDSTGKFTGYVDDEPLQVVAEKKPLLDYVLIGVFWSPLFAAVVTTLVAALDILRPGGLGGLFLGSWLTACAVAIPLKLRA